jgi:Fe-S cluster biogenesis protein NfuA
MTTPDPHPFLDGMRRVEERIEEIERSADPAARAAAQEMVRALLDLHGAPLARMTELLAEAGEPGRAVLDACGRDELVGPVLLLHGMHPLDLETRARQSLDRVRPRLRSHGGDAELLAVANGVVRVRLHASANGCHSTAGAMRSLVEQALADATPDAAAVEIEGGPEPPAPAQLVQLGRLSRV